MANKVGNINIYAKQAATSDKGRLHRHVKESFSEISQ